MRSPSIKSLTEWLRDPVAAKECKRIFRMSRDELLALPAGDRRERECYHSPKLWDLRMHCLDAVCGTYGIEGFRIRKGEHVEYLNAGDTYAATIVYFRGNYRLATWGDYAEKYGTSEE
jgi:hypothetical protein